MIQIQGDFLGGDELPNRRPVNTQIGPRLAGKILQHASEGRIMAMDGDDRRSELPAFLNPQQRRPNPRGCLIGKDRIFQYFLQLRGRFFSHLLQFVLGNLPS